MPRQSRRKPAGFGRVMELRRQRLFQDLTVPDFLASVASSANVSVKAAETWYFGLHFPRQRHYSGLAKSLGYETVQELSGAINAAQQSANSESFATIVEPSRIAYQPDMHRDKILKYIVDKHPKLLRLFHFSGTYCQNIIPVALECGAEVRLYVKDPEFEKERSLLQYHRIKSSLSWYAGGSGFPKRSSLRIFLCKFWPVIKATIIDRDLICLGPYLLDLDVRDQWKIVPYPEILIETATSPEFKAIMHFLESYEKTMVVEEFCLWDFALFS